MSVKRIISLIVALSMLLTVCGGSALAAGQTGYSDVDGTGYETAVSILRTLGIMSGYTDGQFHPYATITRAEMAELAVRLRGITDYGTEVSDEEIQYKDMVGHPLAAAVAYARSLGIVDGGTDGYFYPDDPVTYEQAVKMIVGAIGYDYYATARADYPNGYLMVANELKLTSGVGVTVGSYITRGDVAKIACNALTVDMMVPTSYSGSKVTYEIVEGKNILNTYFNVEKLRGVVEENEFTSLYGSSDLEPGEVRIGDEVFYAGLTNVGDYLGYYVSFYAIELDTRAQRVVISYKVESSRNDYIKINAEDIENVSIGSGGEYTIEYWRSRSAKNTTDVQLSATPLVVFNGVALPDFNLDDLNPKYGQVTLMDTDGDKQYDYADVISYEVFTVLSASEASGTVSAYPAYTTGIRSAQLKLDEDDDTNSIVRIIDGNGNNVPLSSIKKNSVLFVAISKDTGSTVRTAIVSNNSISGRVSGVTGDGSYMINGVSYETISYMDEALSVGDTGTFFLSHDGRIAGFDGEKRVSKNIGMFVTYNRGKLSEGGDAVKIFKADGSFGIYNLAGTVKLNGQNISGSDLFELIANDDSSVALFGRREPDSSNAGKYIPEPARSGILFKLNSNGDISELVVNTNSNSTATVKRYEELPTGNYDSNELRGVVQRGKNSGYKHPAPWENNVYTDITTFVNQYDDSRKKFCGSESDPQNRDDSLYYDTTYRCFQRGGLPLYVSDNTVLLMYGDNYSLTDDSQAYSVRVCNQLRDDEPFEWHEFYFYYFGNSEYPEFAVCYDDYDVPENTETYYVNTFDEDWSVLGGNNKNIVIVDRIVEEYAENDEIRYRLYYWESGASKDAYFHKLYDDARYRTSGQVWRRGDMIRFIYVNNTREIGRVESLFGTAWNDPVGNEETGGYNSHNVYKFPIGFWRFNGNNNYWRQLYYIGRVTAIESTKYFTTISMNNNYEHNEATRKGQFLDKELLTGTCYKLQYNNRGYISGVDTVGTDSLAENQLVLVHKQGQVQQYRSLRIIESYILYEYDDIAADNDLINAYRDIYPEL